MRARWVVAIVVVSVAVSTAGGTAQARPSSGAPSFDAVPDSIRAVLAHPPDAPLRATSAPDRGAVVVSGAGTISVPDPPWDVADSAGDITNLSVTRTATSTRFGMTTAAPHHNTPSEEEVWWLDRDGNGTANRAIFATEHYSGQMIAGVATLGTNSQLLCAGSTTENPISVSVPSACLGTLPSLHVAAQLHTGEINSRPQEDSAPDVGLAGPVTLGSATPTAVGGLVMKTSGFFSWFGVTKSRSAPAIWDYLVDSLPDFPRAFAIGPDGSNGYVVDGLGDIVPFGLGADFGGPQPIDAPTFPFDAARGIAVASDGRRGWVLDAFGALHHFSVGVRRSAPAVIDVPYWNGWDIARGVALLPDRSGGFVLDGFGGLHFFSIGTRRAAPRVIGGPYWNGWDIARGVALLPNGSGGYVVDAFGGMHPFSLGIAKTMPAIVGLPYRAGTNFVAGLSLVRNRVDLPVAAPPPVVVLPGARSSEFGVDGKLVYAVADDVAVIDVATESIVDHIAVGDSPGALAFSPDQTRLAVVNTGSADVSIVDVANRTEIKRIALPAMGNTPYVAYANGGKVFVADMFGGHLYRVDVASGVVTEVVTEIGESGVPVAIVMRGSANGAKLAMAGLASGTGGLAVKVRTFDVATSSFTATAIAPFPFAQLDVDINHDGSRVVLGPVGPVYDGNLVPVMTSVGAAGRFLSTLDFWGTHWYQVSERAMYVTTLNGSAPPLTHHLFDLVFTNVIGGMGRISVSADLKTVAVITTTGVELVKN